MASPDTQAASRLLGGIAKNPGSFNSWTAAAPFTSGTWFGYWRSVSCGTTTISKVHVWETAETWTVVLEDSTGAFYRMDIGCFVDPDSTDALDAESDGRLAGVRTSGATAISANYWTASVISNAWMAHSTADGQAHCGVFQPSTSTIWALVMFIQPRASTTTAARSASGRYRRFRPIWHRNQAAPNDYIVGIERLSYVTADTKAWKQLVTPAGSSVGWSVAGSNSADQDADLLLS
jgi:hypothetical protein